MVFIENLKDQFVEIALSYWDRLQESSLYIRVNERFTNLPRSSQIGIVAGGAATVAMILLLIPFSYYSEGSEQQELYENTVALIKSLDKVNRASSDLNSIPRGMEAEEMKGAIQSILDRARVLPEQVISLSAVSVSKAPPSASKGMIWKTFPSEQVVANLKKLNLRQVVEIGGSVERSYPGIIFLDMALNANSEDSHYYDANFVFASFNLDASTDNRKADGPSGSKGR